MNHTETNQARERIATAILAAMIGVKEEWAPGNDGRRLGELACEYANALLLQLERFADHPPGRKPTPAR